MAVVSYHRIEPALLSDTPVVGSGTRGVILRVAIGVPESHVGSDTVSGSSCIVRLRLIKFFDWLLAAYVCVMSVCALTTTHGQILG